MPHIQGALRDEVLLFPPSLDQYITDDNPVRFIDAFIDLLDLQALGFTRAIAAPRGRPPYHPADLLKGYVYGYLNHIRSSRLLERETHRNIEVMWLLKNSHPISRRLLTFAKTICSHCATSVAPLPCSARILICSAVSLWQSMAASSGR